MKLLFGLGNPGEKFTHTRHNLGFMAIDSFAHKHAATFTTKSKFSAEAAELSIGTEKVILIKPSTFYNESGRSYRALLDFYKVDPTETLIIHDELALPFGVLRLRHGGSDAGNNGIKSINQQGGERSVRIRAGTGNDLRSQMGDIDFVLGKFSRDEVDTLVQSTLPAICELMSSFIADTHQPTSISTVPEAGND